MTFLRNFTFPLLLALCVSRMFAQTNPAIPDAHLTFTTIDAPGAGFTNVAGINSAGDMVGYYGAGSNANKRGFLYKGGSFTNIDYPGADSTFAEGINDSGLIAGSADFHGGVTGNGFIYDGTAFTAVSTREPVTFLWSINNRDEIVGSTGVSGGDFRGFASVNGRFRTLRFPGQYQIANPTGINNLGQVAGYTIDGSSTLAYVYSNGCFKNLSFPGALYTQAQGINDNGLVVGTYFVSPNLYGFAYYKGKYISYTYPGAIATGATAVNNSGQIVGQYLLPDLTWHGFVTSPITSEDFN